MKTQFLSRSTMSPSIPAVLVVLAFIGAPPAPARAATPEPEASAAEAQHSSNPATEKAPAKPGETGKPVAGHPPPPPVTSTKANAGAPAEVPDAPGPVGPDAALLLEQAIQLQQTNAELKAARVLLERLRDAPGTPEIIRQEVLRRLKQIAPAPSASGAGANGKSKPSGVTEADPPLELYIPPGVHQITISGEAEAKAPDFQPNLNFPWNTPPPAGTKPAPNPLPGGPIRPDWRVSWDPSDNQTEDRWSAVFSKIPGPFSSDLRTLESLSLTEASADDLRSAAFEAIAKKLHPDAEFLPNDPADGTPENPLTGVGMVLSTIHEGMVCREIVPDSPAARAGIVPGSELTKVDGRTLFALGGKLEKVVKAIRGPEGTEVSLTLIPPGASERTITLKRSLISLQPPPVCQPLAKNPDNPPKWVLEDGVVGIQLNALEPGSAGEIRKVLENPAHQPVRALVLDLSQNGGGSVEEVSKILNLFLTKGSLYTRREKGGTLATTLRNPWTKPPFPDLRLTVLISNATAMGAEVLTAALQDHHRAAIIGQRSLGRATIFQSVPFQTGMMRVPVAELCRADGKGIERKPGMTDKDSWGVIPDIIVPEAPAPPLNIRYSRQFEPFDNVESVVPEGPDPVFADKAEHQSDAGSEPTGISSKSATQTPGGRIAQIPHTVSVPVPPATFPSQPEVLKTALKYLHEKLEAK